MARDEIAEAFQKEAAARLGVWMRALLSNIHRQWSLSPGLYAEIEQSMLSETPAFFRAGAVWALRRAEGIVQTAKKRVMPASAEMVVADIASALASLSPAPPRPEKE